MEFCVRKLLPCTPKFVIKNIINYFIGNYLLNELNENQIEVIDNYAQCTNIDLNIKAINDNFEKQNIPLNVLYGFIGCIRINLSGCAIDGKLLLEIRDLEISLGPVARAKSPDPDVVFGTMVDGMINMDRSFHDENLSNLIFEEKQKGKNFNALISKWIGKVCLTLHNTRISFESRPIPQINRCCRFLCEIDTLEFGTRDIDSVNMNSSALMGILLTNNIEFSGFILRWEVASQKSDGSMNTMSETNSCNEILYGCQLLSIIKPVLVNYTLLLNNNEPEFEMNITIDTVHLLLSPLPLHWIQLLLSQIAMVDFDPSISKNVKMTESQFESFFANEEKQQNSFKSQANESSIYYDVESSTDDNSIHSTAYDDITLDNSDEDDQFCEFTKDNATCASMCSNITIFDDDGKMNPNFKASISTKNVCVKVLLRNPSNDTDSWENSDDLFDRTSDYTHWDYISKQFFGLLKTVDKAVDPYDALLTLHKESGKIDYFSFFSTNVIGSVTNKRFNDKFHRSVSFSTDNLQFSETVFNNSEDGTTMQIISIVPANSILENKAIDAKAEYNSTKNEVSLDISMGKCYIGLDISIQDRIRPLLQNNIIEYSVSDKTNSYELNKSPDQAGLSFGCITVVNVSDICLELFVPLVNLNEALHSKCYWQYRQLHQETLQISTVNCRWLCRIPAISNNDDKDYSPQIVIELYAPSIIVSLATGEDNGLEIMNIINDAKEPSVMINIKSKLEHHLDHAQTNYSLRNPDDSIFPYCNPLISNKNSSKPYSTKEKNNSKNHSTAKVIHTPQNRDRIKQYIRKSVNNSYFDIEINASTILMAIYDKEVLKVLYDRLMFDLILWEPCFDKRTNDVIVNYKSKEVSETDDEANTDTSFDEDVHSSQTKTKCKFPTKKFTCNILSSSVRCYLQSTISEKSETILEIEGMELFMDSDMVQGLVESQSMMIMEIERCRIFHSDNKIIDSDSNKLRNTEFILNDNYNLVLDHVPVHINDSTVTDPSNKMFVLIMESQILKLKKTSRPSNRAKQKAATMVTANLNEACLRVNFVNDSANGLEWFIAMIDMFSLNNPVITGYTFPDSDMTIYLHSNNCAIDFCFSRLTMSIFALLHKVQLEMNLNSTESYYLSSEIGFTGSQIFIRPNDMVPLDHYFLWNNNNWLPSSLLDEGFVFVADFGSLDIRFTKIGSTNYAEKTSTCSLEVTNSETKVHFCADSLSLMVTCLKQLMLSLTESNTEQLSGANNTNPLSNRGPSMNEEQKTELNIMITDAMIEDNLVLKNHKHHSEEYCDDFLLVDDIFSNVHDRVVNLENSTVKLSVVPDHYKAVASEDQYSKMKRAIFKDPSGYPTVDNSLVVHDFSLSVSFYAGSDFEDANEPKRSSSINSKTNTKPVMILPVTFQRFGSDSIPKVTIETTDYDAYYGDSRATITRGGTNRKSREAYQWNFSKINFRYAMFSNTSLQTFRISRRLVFIVNKIEIISNNSLSGINKVLFCDTNAPSWYDPKAPMVSVKMIFTQPDPNHDVVNEECDIVVSIQPIRLNFDQEIVLFSEKFYQDLNSKDIINNKIFDSKTQRSYSSSTPSESPHQEKDSILIPPNNGINKELSLGRGGGIDSITGSSPLSRASTIRMPAFDEMRSKSESGEKPHLVNTSRSLSSVFIRHFKLYPDISVKLDYTGTRLDFTQGALKGLFYILMQLNDVVLVIKNKQYLGGITGLDVLIGILIKDIYEEFYSQLKSIFSKVGVMSEVTEILTGIYDFFTLPYIHYHSEGGIIEGIKLGTRSITSTSLWAALTMLSKGLKIFQKMAETTYDLVSPADYTHLDESYHAGRDIREGMTNAAHGVRRRFHNTATDLRHALARSDRAIVGRIGDVIRQVPPALASPIVATCEATNQLVDGLRYQLKPEMKIEDEKKWKQ